MARHWRVKRSIAVSARKLRPASRRLAASQSPLRLVGSLSRLFVDINGRLLARGLGLAFPLHVADLVLGRAMRFRGWIFRIQHRWALGASGRHGCIAVSRVATRDTLASPGSLFD